MRRYGAYLQDLAAVVAPGFFDAMEALVAQVNAAQAPCARLMGGD